MAFLWLLLWIKLLNTLSRTAFQRKLSGITVKIQASGASLPLADISVNSLVLGRHSQSRLKQRSIAMGLSVLWELGHLSLQSRLV